jgi:energy-coupling factor transport system permease protein
MNVHPAVLILMWCVFVTFLQRAPYAVLLSLAALALVIGGWLAGRKLLQLLRRTRWIMLSLLCIYAYSTPGVVVIPPLGGWSPVYEGLQDGAAQLLRLLAALAGLALLLDRLHRLELISGLYSLFAPLRCLGVSRERCAIRLALTLQYAEVAMMRSEARWQDALQGLFDSPTAPQQAIALPLHRWAARDVVLAGLLGVLIVGLILR